MRLTGKPSAVSACSDLVVFRHEVCVSWFSSLLFLMEPKVSLENFVFSQFPELDENFEDVLDCLPDTVGINSDSNAEPGNPLDETALHNAILFEIDFKPDSE